MPQVIPSLKRLPTVIPNVSLEPSAALLVLKMEIFRANPVPLANRYVQVLEVQFSGRALSVPLAHPLQCIFGLNLKWKSRIGLPKNR